MNPTGLPCRIRFLAMPDWMGDDRPPANWRRLHEAGSLIVRFWHGLGHLRPRGPVDGPPALVIPGWVASDRTTLALRRAFAEAGWRVHGWELGFNWGARPDTVERLRARLEQVGQGRKVLLVGWSWGGLYARELGRAAPDQILAVVTLGSPFSGDPKQNNVWRMYELIAGHKVDDPPIPRITEKPPVPHLAFWSRRDGIVAPRSARGLEDERDKAVELGCTHMGMGVSTRAVRDAVREIGRFLEELNIAPESHH
jgi:pimeloyl-ACP methyl ester carboxylesterase